MMPRKPVGAGGELHPWRRSVSPPGQDAVLALAGVAMAIRGRRPARRRRHGSATRSAGAVKSRRPRFQHLAGAAVVCRPRRNRPPSATEQRAKTSRSAGAGGNAPSLISMMTIAAWHASAHWPRNQCRPTTCVAPTSFYACAGRRAV